MSRYTGHASLQELLGRSVGGGGYGGYGGGSNGSGSASQAAELLLPPPTSPTGEARARLLLPAGVAEALYGGRKRSREGEEEKAPAPVLPPPPAVKKVKEEKGDGGGEPSCPVCGRALVLFASSSFASSSSSALDLESVNRHVDACLIASKRRASAAGSSGAAAASSESGNGKQKQKQASLLGMRKVIKVKREEPAAAEAAAVAAAIATATAAAADDDDAAAAASLHRQEEKEEDKDDDENGDEKTRAAPPLPLSLPSLSDTCFESRLVSRRHVASANSSSSSSPSAKEITAASLAAGAVVSLLREKANAADGAAVRAVAFPGSNGSLGYLPSCVSSKLAPLLDVGGCAATVTLCEGLSVDSSSTSSRSSLSSLRVRVEVILPPEKGNGGGDGDESVTPNLDLLQLVAAAAEAAREDTARSSSGPGGKLLSVALPALEAALTPREQGGDAHLFSPEESLVFASLRGGGVPREAVALFLRIYCSRRPSRWVRPSKMAASEVTSVKETAAAALSLVRAGLAVPLLFGNDDGGGSGGGGENGGENALLAAADALTLDELRAALLSFSKDNSAPASSSSSFYSSPISASVLRRMPKTELLSLAARALRGRESSKATRALSSALAVPPPPALSSTSTSSIPPSPSPLPAFRLRTAAMRALRRCERAAFLSEGVTFAAVAAAASGGMRSLPRYRADRVLGISRAGPPPPPAFASRADLLEYERALTEAAALDDALNLSLAASTAAERAEADAAVEAAIIPCVDFVTRRRQRGGGNGSGSGGGGSKENAPTTTTAAAATQQLCSSAPSPPPPQPSSSSSVAFLTRFSALWVRLSCATAAASWLEMKRRRTEADEIYWGCLGVTAPPSSSSSSSASRSSNAGGGGGRSSQGIQRFRRRGHWWTRLALNAEAAGRPSQALEIVESALADDPENVSWGYRLGLMRRGFRLAKPPRRWRAPPAAWAAAAEREPREQVLVASTLDPSSAPNNAKSIFEGNLTVEQLALSHYSRPENGGWKGAHAEGGVWGCLFRALFHDVMFSIRSPSENRLGGGGGSSNGGDPRALSMLRVPCQRYPLDFGSPIFYEVRKGAIDPLLKRIRGADPAAVAGMVSSAWDRGLGPYAAGGTEGRWNASPGGREELRELCGCLGGRALAAVLELFARGLAREGGMPDLVLWRRRSESEGRGSGDDDEKEKEEKTSSSHDLFGEAMVVEVKGPRDRLSVRFSFLF